MRKFTKILLSVLVMLVSLGIGGVQKVQADDAIVYELTYSQNDLKFEKQEGFDTVKLPDCILSRDVGSPEIPIKVLQFAIDDKANKYSVQILSDETVEIPGQYYLYPAQQSCPLNKECPFTEPTDEIYNSSQSYPQDLIQLGKKGTMSGVDIAAVVVYPLEYIPAQQKLVLHTKIKFQLVEKKVKHRVSIRSSHKTLKQKVISRKSPKTKRQTKRLLKKLLSNPESIEQSFAMDSGGTGSFGLDLTSNSELSAPSVSMMSAPTTQVDYLIITSETLKTSGVFQPLINSKVAKGLSVYLETVENIASAMSGRDVPEKIRNYIISLHQNNGLTWVLLGGDTNIVPHRYVQYGSWDGRVIGGEDSGPVVSDMYYSDLDGTWDSDGDLRFLDYGDQSPDLYPDVFVGRAPVENVMDAQAFVNKVLTYEANINNYANSAALFGCFDFGNAGAITNEYIDAHFISEDFQVLKYYEQDIPVYHEQARDAMNEGYHILNHIDHSGFANMSFGSGSLYISDFENLNNNDKPSIFWSAGCLAAAIDVDAIAEHFITNPNGGGVAFIGNSRLGYDPETTAFSPEFYQSLFLKGINRIGQTHINSLIPFFSMAAPATIMRHCVLELNLLGDPEMEIGLPTPGVIKTEVTWRDMVGVSSTGNDLKKIYSTRWGNAGAASAERVLRNGGVEFTATETNTSRMVGLSYSNRDANYTTIEYAVYLRYDGALRVYERGVYKGTFGTYHPGDIISIERFGMFPIITYKQNGKIFYRSHMKSSGGGSPMLVDTALYSKGATIKDVKVYQLPTYDVAWVDLVGVNLSGTTLTKNTAMAWNNSGAASDQSLEGDGGFYFRASETNTARMIGLSYFNVDNNYSTIDYAILLRSDGTISVYEKGICRGIVSPYKTGDYISVERTGTKIEYKVNGSVVYTSAVPSSGAMLVDAAFWNITATITDAKIFYR